MVIVLCNQLYIFLLQVFGLKELQVVILPPEERAAFTIALHDTRTKSVAKDPNKQRNAHQEHQSYLVRRATIQHIPFTPGLLGNPPHHFESMVLFASDQGNGNHAYCHRRRRSATRRRRSASAAAKEAARIHEIQQHLLLRCLLRRSWTLICRPSSAAALWSSPLPDRARLCCRRDVGGRERQRKRERED